MELRYVPTAVAIGAFLAASYLICSAWDGLFPNWAMHSAWEALLPGFTWWSFGSFLLGLAESFAYGFWLVLVVPLVGSPTAPPAPGPSPSGSTAGRRDHQR